MSLAHCKTLKTSQLRFEISPGACPPCGALPNDAAKLSHANLNSGMTPNLLTAAQSRGWPFHITFCSCASSWVGLWPMDGPVPKLLSHLGSSLPAGTTGETKVAKCGAIYRLINFLCCLVVIVNPFMRDSIPSSVKMLFKFVLSFLFAASVAGQCNGNVALCSRKYSNVTQIGTHDSAFVGVLPTDNQYVSLTSQLNAGIRFLQAQTHVKNSALEMCHTTCGEKDAGSLVSYLTTITTWMAANPNEVVTLLLTNGDGASVSLFGSAMISSGLSAYAYTPPSQLSMFQWPTLQELIDNETRLVMFLGTYLESLQRLL